ERARERETDDRPDGEGGDEQARLGCVDAERLLDRGHPRHPAAEREPARGEHHEERVAPGYYRVHRMSVGHRITLAARGTRHDPLLSASAKTQSEGARTDVPETERGPQPEQGRVGGG